MTPDNRTFSGRSAKKKKAVASSKISRVPDILAQSFTQKIASHSAFE
jgi:hypothetical protein